MTATGKEAVQNSSSESQNSYDYCHPGALRNHLHLKQTSVMKY